MQNAKDQAIELANFADLSLDEIQNISFYDNSPYPVYGGYGMSGGGGASNPMAQQMKVLQYIFPVMLLVIFNNFASGLSLYYLVFNLLSVIQQVYIKKTLNAQKEAKA